MEIVLERIAKKNTYTIGRLYLLADGDVKRKVISGKTAGDKRSFEHSFDLEKLSKESYFCDTLEPTWRNLKGVELKPEEENARFSRESGKVARKDSGPYRHPRGFVSCAHHPIAPIQEVVAVCAGCSWFRGHPHPCRQLSRRHPGLHPGGREQGEGYGGELPHLAPSSDEPYSGGGESGRRYLDYRHLMKG